MWDVSYLGHSGAFTVKLMKLKLWVPHLHRPFQSREPNSVSEIFFILRKGPSHSLYKLQDPQNLDLLLHVCCCGTKCTALSTVSGTESGINIW